MDGSCGWVGCTSTCVRCCDEIARLRAEVERLTQALELERKPTVDNDSHAEALNVMMLMSGSSVRLGTRSTRALVMAFSERTRERDDAVAHLREVLGGECETAGRWCLTHRTNDCAVPGAREFLARVKP